MAFKVRILSRRDWKNSAGKGFQDSAGEVVDVDEHREGIGEVCKCPSPDYRCSRVKLSVPAAVYNLSGRTHLERWPIIGSKKSVNGIELLTSPR